MKMIESALSLSCPAVNSANTNAAPPESLASAAVDDEWDAVQNTLIDLAPKHDDPQDRIDEDGYMLPTGQAIASASKLAAQLRRRGEMAPRRVIQDAVGGIVLEWRSGKAVERLTVNRRGDMEVAIFRDSELAYRTQLTR
jgi:hypothetical protein